MLYEQALAQNFLSALFGVSSFPFWRYRIFDVVKGNRAIFLALLIATVNAL